MASPRVRRGAQLRRVAGPAARSRRDAGPAAWRRQRRGGVQRGPVLVDVEKAGNAKRTAEVVFLLIEPRSDLGHHTVLMYRSRSHSVTVSRKALTSPLREVR